ncbi:MAG: hypothetical protein AAB229_02690 [Candidatus Hydrogenedentota bacterium]
MKAKEKEIILRSIKAWELASVTLEEDRIRRIREADVKGTLDAFDGMVELYLASRPSRTTSGLVEQQAWFRRMYR